MVENNIEYYQQRLFEEFSKYGIKPLQTNLNSNQEKKGPQVHEDVVDYLNWLDEFEDPQRQIPRRVISLA